MLHGKVIIVLPPGAKGLREKDWPDKAVTWEEIERRRANNPTINVGLLLGPRSGVIDIEGDGPAAEAELHVLFGGEPSVTPSFRSRGGIHRLYEWDYRFAPFGATKRHGDVEFRFGAKSAQSCIPPSIVDGVPREEIVNLRDHTPAKLPDDIVVKIVSMFEPDTTTFDNTPHDFLGNVEAKLRARAIERWEDLLTAADIPYRVEIDGDTTKLIFAYCPFRGPKHKDGNAAILIGPDGSVGLHCFHAKCQDRTLADLERLLRPTIRVGPDEDRMVAGAVAALAHARNVFNRGGVLVRITHDAKPPLCIRATTAPRLEQIPLATAGEILSSVANWEKFDGRGKKWIRCQPPGNVASAVFARSDLPTVPIIEAVVSSPVLRADGTIWTTSGYDPQSGLFLNGDMAYPRMMETTAAVNLLLDLIADFPLASAAYRSGWIAALLTLFGRAAFAGPAPIFLIDANVSGACKTLLADLIAMIFERRVAARTSVPTDDSEWRKLITGLVLAAPPYVLLDNIRGKFGSPSLEKALTSETWSDRILGESKTISAPINTVWLATSNNATVTTDLARRALHIRLNSPHENPGERSDFKHRHLLDHAKRDQPMLAIAALSILANYIEAGRPNQQLTPWGSFEGWSDLVRSAVVWKGLPDPGETRTGLAAEADDETTMLHRLVDAWCEVGCPATVATVFGMLESNCDPQRFPVLREIVDELSGPNKRDALGKLLRKFRGRVIGGQCFERAGSKWELKRVTP